jgi:hypothetical protein
MHATRAAVEEGIVPGGGVALARCIPALDKPKVEGDEQIGVNIVKRALQEPLRQIAENAGEEGAIVLGKVNDSKGNNFGYNALTGEYEDLVKAGVLDPTKVVRTALTNVGSIAALMLTTEALVADITEESKGVQTGGHGGMGDMYWEPGIQSATGEWLRFVAGTAGTAAPLADSAGFFRTSQNAIIYWSKFRGSILGCGVARFIHSGRKPRITSRS